MVQFENFMCSSCSQPIKQIKAKISTLELHNWQLSSHYNSGVVLFYLESINKIGH